MSPYYVIPRKEIDGMNKKKTLSKPIEQGHFYTVFLGNPLILIGDQKAGDRTKAVLAFYNFSSKDNLTLKANYQIPVFEKIGLMKAGSRDLNEAKIDLGIYGADRGGALP